MTSHQEEYSLLKDLSLIATNAEETQLNEEFFTQNKKVISRCAQILGLEEKETVLFALLLETTDYHHNKMGKIREYLGFIKSRKKQVPTS